MKIQVKVKPNSKSQVRILSGFKSRNKIIEVAEGSGAR